MKCIDCKWFLQSFVSVTEPRQNSHGQNWNITYTKLIRGCTFPRSALNSDEFVDVENPNEELTSSWQCPDIKE